MASAASQEEDAMDNEPQIDWPFVLISSYASALTVALFWLFWTGRITSSPSLETSSDATSVPAFKSTPAPAQNAIDLGMTRRIGDLELSPRSIVHRAVELIRLESASGEQRETPDAYVLTLRLTNRSQSVAFPPLDAAFVRDSNGNSDQSFIETSDGRRISMFPLAPESEWSIQDQVFPTLKPEESVETVIVSQPVPKGRFQGPMTWHLRLRTSPSQTELIGIRFLAPEVIDQSH
jgi:hypothetical protein